MEISSHLLKLQPTIVVLIETRVKQEKAQKIRDKLCLKGRYLDNYNHHENGRLWIEWNDNKVDVRYVRSTSQFIHCGVYDLAGTFKFWLTAIYAHNQLNERKKLWKDLEEIHDMQQGPWCAVVFQMQDENERIHCLCYHWLCYLVKKGNFVGNENAKHKG